MNFFSRLETRTQEIDSLLCIGLDPHPEDLSAPTGPAAHDFCMRLIEATHKFAAAYKPNAAFFEALGSEGIEALRAVIAAVPDQIPVLLDAKRGDIASTARAYARAVFEVLGADAVTLNPYLGRDSVLPFIEDPSHGVFLLCKTSNPGAKDLQDLPLGKLGMATLYEYVAHLASTWNENGNIGLVVGATQLNALKRVRAAAPNLWFLAPGVGAQGGDLKGALDAGLRTDGMGMLIPVSRGISRAADPRQAGLDLRDDINKARELAKSKNTGSQSRQPAEAVRDTAQTDQGSAKTALSMALLKLGCVRFGNFTLKSGHQSPIYIDLRRLVADPPTLAMAADAYLPILRELDFEHLAALPYVALPIGTAISLSGGWPLIYPRKEVKAYGTRAPIEGVFQPGDRAVVIDDLITTGLSKVEGIEKLTSAGLQVADIVVLIDRQSGGSEPLAAHGWDLHSVFTLPDLLSVWEREGSLEPEKAAEVRAFLLQSG